MSRVLDVGDTIPSPKDVCRGWFIPVDLVELWEAEQITADDLVLLSKINSLQTRDRGCFATNEWLGKWMRKHPVNISKAINRYVDMGLLIPTYKHIGTKVTERQLRVTFAGKVQTTVSANANGAVSANAKETVLLRKTKLPSAGVENATQGERFLAGAVEHLLTYYANSKHNNPNLSNRRKWKRVLQWLLLKDLNGDKRRMKFVIQTYTSKRHDKFTPRVHSPFEFRQKFFKIETWVTEDEEDAIQPKSEYIVEIKDK